MRTLIAIALAAVATLPGQTFRTDSFHGRKSYVLENDKMVVSLLRGGGHIAEVRFRSGDERTRVNPMRVPHYQTIEPYEYNPARHDELYGSDPHRWLSSGYMGHLLCFPAFGAPSSPEEVKAGLGNHGEAPIVEWKQSGTPVSANGALTFRYGADLPKTQYRVDRAVTLPAGESVAYIEETVENLTAYDRPINWVQHATFGPPFIAPGKSYLDMNGTTGQVAGGVDATSSLKPNSSVSWPDGIGPDGSKVSLRAFQPQAGSGTYFAVLMSQKRPISFFTMYNSDFPVLIGYLFRTSESPWVGDFQENQRMSHKPWGGKTITRGIEFGTTPFAEGLKKSVERGYMYGVPTYRWIGGKQRLQTTYAVFLAPIPGDFAGVQDVTAENGVILIRERGSSREIKLPASKLALLN